MDVLRNYLRFVVRRRGCGRDWRGGTDGDAGHGRGARRVDHVWVDVLVVGLLRRRRRSCGSRLRVQISSCLKRERKTKSELEHDGRVCVGAASAFGFCFRTFSKIIFPCN